MNHLPKKAIFAAVFCNILFGSAVPMIKLGYQQFHITDDVFSKILYAGIRFFVSGILVWLFDAVRQRRFPRLEPANRKNVVLLGLTNTFLQYVFFYMGLSRTTGASGSVVNSSAVFMGILLAHFLYVNDKLNAQKVIGCVLGFAGVAIACFANESAGRFSLFGEGFILISDAFFIIGSAINKKASQINHSFTVTGYQLLVGGSLLILVGLCGYRGGITVTWQGILVLFGLILVSSVGFSVWSMLLKSYPMGKLSVYNLVIPISGTFFSGMFLRENIFTARYMIALALVSVGICIVNYTVGKTGKASLKKI